MSLIPLGFTPGGDFATLYQGECLAPNGKIYAALSPASTDIPTSYNTIFYGGILATNGCIYCIPGSSKFIKYIDSSGTINNGIDASALYPTPTTGSYRLWFGGVCAPNGKIFLMPWSTPNIGVVRTGLPTLPLWMLSAQFNKY